jgi:hypothetical protein
MIFRINPIVLGISILKKTCTQEQQNSDRTPVTPPEQRRKCVKDLQTHAKVNANKKRNRNSRRKKKQE